VTLIERVQARRAEEQLASGAWKSPEVGEERYHGPKLTDRQCSLGCGRFLAVTNKRGVCAKCAQNNWRRLALKHGEGK
jgi:ribosomal protein S27AE